jgi:hypothetical protein
MIEEHGFDLLARHGPVCVFERARDASLTAAREQPRVLASAAHA